jgi:hypothetical protein
MREIIGVTIAFLGLCLVGAEADDIRVQVFGNLVGAVMVTAPVLFSIKGARK